MANYNLTNQTISSSFQQLLQKDIDTGYLVDGIGDNVGDITISGSVSASAFIGDGSQLTNLPVQALPSGVVSGSSQIDVTQTTNIATIATTGSNSFIGVQTIAGNIEKYGGDYIDYIGGNIQTLGGRVAGTNMGNTDGSSNHTGSFSGDGSQLTNIPHTEIPQGTVSGSSQIILEDTTGNLSGSRIEGAVALATNSVSASIANSATTALLATSASHAEVADEVPYSGVTGKPTLVSGSSQVSYPELSNIPSGIVSGSSQVTLEDTTFTDGTQYQVLRTDGAGNLSFDYADRTQIEIRTDESIVKGDPLYVTGFSDGENRVTVAKADASDPSKMPAYGVAYESVSQNTNTQMVALGTLQNIDTQTPNYNVGDTLYVAVGGGLTNVKPTGTNLIQNFGIVGRIQQNSGEILVSAIGRSNDLPNIQEGYAWVGDSNRVPQAVATSSFAGG